ncbi:MAG: hypothetical protein U0894_06925 [Pirellulales bacterium]
MTGKLTAEAAKLLELTTDCVVVGAATVTVQRMLLGRGWFQGTLSTSIGTCGIMFVHSDEVQIDPAGRLHVLSRGTW